MNDMVSRHWGFLLRSQAHLFEHTREFLFTVVDQGRPVLTTELRGRCRHLNVTEDPTSLETRSLRDIQ